MVLLKLLTAKKNIFKLSIGEYVAAENLEVIYSKSRFVGQMFVYGDSFTPFLVAIVHPETAFVKHWATEQKITTLEMKDLCENKTLKEAVMEDFKKINKENKLQGFERIEAVILTPTEWTPENELVTPTFKLKRPQLKNFYEDGIVDLYASLKIDLPYAKKKATPKEETPTKKKKQHKEKKSKKDKKSDDTPVVVKEESKKEKKESKSEEKVSKPEEKASKSEKKREQIRRKS